MLFLPQVSIIVPLYNEEAVLPFLIDRLLQLMNQLDFDIEIIFVDDGSVDTTRDAISRIALLDHRFTVLSFSRNFGHSAALTAGLEVSRGTIGVMVIDGDLQDPPELITVFLQKYKEGYDIVYGVRENRKESYWKKVSYYIFYRLLSSISSINLPLDSGDFGFISRKAVDIINSMPEESRYLRGMRSWIGFNQVGVAYDRNCRAAGSSKYSFRKLIKLAYNGIFNFSEVPIKFITNLGLFSILIALIYLGYALVEKLFYDNIPEGFTGLLFAIVLFSGVQLISLGVIGEYVMRIFFQVKGRPKYVLKNKIIDKKFINGQGLL